MLWQKVDVLFVDDVVQAGAVWHECSPAATFLEICVVKDAVDGLWLRVYPWHQNNVVATALGVRVGRSDAIETKRAWKDRWQRGRYGHCSYTY